MRIIISLIFCIASVTAIAQVPDATVQADVKKDFGPNCTSVKTVGSGALSTEYVNGGYSTFYRVNVVAILKTELPGVTRIAKGAAKYSKAGAGKYSYVQYAPGTETYEGMQAPDTAAIRALIYSMADYGMPMAGHIIDILQINFMPGQPIWHTLLSVEIPADMIYTVKKNYKELETIQHPYGLRLYRKTLTGPWDGISWVTPDYRNDHRVKKTIAIKEMGEYAMSKLTNWQEKATIKQAEKTAAARPKVDIPHMNTVVDVYKWYHGLLMEGDYAKVEAVTIQLFHPDNIDKRTNLVEGNAMIMLERIKKVLTNDFSTYNKQYCEVPVIFEKSNDEVMWWNKDKTQKSFITIKNENNRWYIYKVGSNVWSCYDEAKAMVTMSTNCN